MADEKKKKVTVWSRRAMAKLQQAKFLATCQDAKIDAEIVFCCNEDITGDYVIHMVDVRRHVDPSFGPEDVIKIYKQYPDKKVLVAIRCFLGGCSDFEMPADEAHRAVIALSRDVDHIDMTISYCGIRAVVKELAVLMNT